MAKCSFANENGTARYFLELSRDEVQTMQDVFARIGGDPRSSNRKHIESVYSAIGRMRIFYRTRTRCGLTRNSNMRFLSPGERDKTVRA